MRQTIAKMQYSTKSYTPAETREQLACLLTDCWLATAITVEF